eukprot:NODE_253_length_11722_cov_0.375118.p1 type:complete len:462 gc:universal NODE_253_length_11722_cov_0.375118:5440-6825(+)
MPHQLMIYLILVFAMSPGSSLLQALMRNRNARRIVPEPSSASAQIIRTRADVNRIYDEIMSSYKLEVANLLQQSYSSGLDAGIEQIKFKIDSLNSLLPTAISNVASRDFSSIPSIFKNHINIQRVQTRRDIQALTIELNPDQQLQFLEAVDPQGYKVAEQIQSVFDNHMQRLKGNLLDELNKNDRNENVIQQITTKINELFAEKSTIFGEIINGQGNEVQRDYQTEISALEIDYRVFSRITDSILRRTNPIHKIEYLKITEPFNVKYQIAFNDLESLKEVYKIRKLKQVDIPLIHALNDATDLQDPALKLKLNELKNTANLLNQEYIQRILRIPTLTYEEMKSDINENRKERDKSKAQNELDLKTFRQFGSNAEITKKTEFDYYRKPTPFASNTRQSMDAMRREIHTITIPKVEIDTGLTDTGFTDTSIKLPTIPESSELESGSTISHEVGEAKLADHPIK